MSLCNLGTGVDGERGMGVNSPVTQLTALHGDATYESLQLQSMGRNEKPTHVAPLHDLPFDDLTPVVTSQ